MDGDGTNDVYLYLSTDKGNSSCVDQFEIGGELSLDHETSGNLIIHQSIKRVWNEDKDYLYPIPTKDRVLTNGALTQNPGWNDGLILILNGENNENEIFIYVFSIGVSL